MTPAGHAATAEELLALADNHNLTDAEERAEAAVVVQMATAHAILASASPCAGHVDSDLLRLAEVDLETVKGERDDLRRTLAAITTELGQYGQDFTGLWDDIPDRVRELMDVAHNREGGPA